MQLNYNLQWIKECHQWPVQHKVKEVNEYCQ